MSLLSQFEFQNGELVKINGQRPEYMSGYQLIRLVKEMAKELKEKSK